MRLLDTSTWIEWLVGSLTGVAIEAELLERDEWLVPTIVQLELAKWLAREIDDDRADQVIAFTLKCVVEPLNTNIALTARRSAPLENSRPRRDRLCDGLGAQRGRLDLRRSL
jgi:predicted nucleic acid-binding protein